MPRIHIKPDPPDKVFNLATVGDLYCKLIWELQNLNTALEAKDWREHLVASYHAFNFAITARHLVDWVWEISKSADGAAALMSETLGNRPINSRKTLANAIGAKYRAIHICGQIANGSKHYETRHLENDYAVGVAVEWDYGEAGKTNGITAVLKIRDGDNVRLASEVFSDAVDAWDSLLRRWGYLEDQFVESDGPLVEYQATQQ